MKAIKVVNIVERLVIIILLSLLTWGVVGLYLVNRDFLYPEECPSVGYEEPEIEVRF